MRRTSQIFYVFAAFLAACGCSAPKVQEPVIASGGVGGTGMAVAGVSQTRVVDFEFTRQRKMGYIAPDRYYPGIARVQRIEGTVELNVTVSPEGQPLSVEIVKGPESLLNAAKEYAFTLQFSPTKKSNASLPRVVTIGIIFQLQKP